MKIQHWNSALALAIVLAGCGGKDAARDADAVDSSAESQSAKAATPTGKYPSKSGIIEWKTDLMGDMTTVVYFDDHGARQASYTTTEIKIFGMTQTTRSVEINADGWTTKYDPDAKTGVRFKTIGGAAAGVPSFPDAGELARMKAELARMEKKGEIPVADFEELPARTILGNEATGFAINAMGMKVRGWIWENIPMRTETDMGGKEPMVTEVTRLELGVAVPADKFAVPADVVITEE